MKKSVLLVLLLGFSFSFSQENYKYVIIPAQFSFFDEINKYGLNELTKAFFQPLIGKVLLLPSSLLKQVYQRKH